MDDAFISIHESYVVVITDEDDDACCTAIHPNDIYTFKDAAENHAATLREQLQMFAITKNSAVSVLTVAQYFHDICAKK